MDEKEFAIAINRYTKARQPDWQGAQCLPRKKSKIPVNAAAAAAGQKSTSSAAAAAAASAPAGDVDFWTRLERYSVSRGMTAKDAAKLVAAAKTIVEQEAVKQ